jgi:hypothetical protein
MLDHTILNGRVCGFCDKLTGARPCNGFGSLGRGRSSTIFARRKKPLSGATAAAADEQCDDADDNQKLDKCEAGVKLEIEPPVRPTHIGRHLQGRDICCVTGGVKTDERWEVIFLKTSPKLARLH